jgi:glutathione S-transferase
MFKLIIANKRLSSWSLRPWLLMRQLGIPFEEHLLPFWHADWSCLLRDAAGTAAIPGTVPVLVDGTIVVGDSLAIVETLAERLPTAGIWPADTGRRAAARVLCAQMHSSFAALRQECWFDALRQGPAKPLSPAATAELGRADGIFAGADPTQGFLCGSFTAADAFYAPLALRTIQYGLSLSPPAAAYVARIATLSAVQEWLASARQERDWPLRGPNGRPGAAAIITADDASRLARAWVNSWNRRDLEAVLGLFADDAIFVSPKAEAFIGRPRVEGKTALRDYWSKALEHIPQLRFEFEAADWDPAAAVVLVTYQADLAGRRARAAERWLLNTDGLIRYGEAYYGAAAP